MTTPTEVFDADVVELLEAFYAEGLETKALLYAPGGGYDATTDTYTGPAPMEVSGVLVNEKTEEDANNAPQRTIQFVYRHKDLPSISTRYRADFQDGNGLWQVKTVEKDPSRSGVILSCSQ